MHAFVAWCLDKDVPCLTCMAYVQAMHDFVARCLDKNPNARMRPGELLQHPFLERANDNVYLAHRLLGAAPQQQLRATRRSSDSIASASEVRQAGFLLAACCGAACLLPTMFVTL